MDCGRFREGIMQAHSVFVRRALPLTIAVMSIVPARASIIWDESVNGDLSGDRFNPTPFVLGMGTSSLIATSSEDPNDGSIDREFFSTTVPAGLALSELRLMAYSGDDQIAFLGVVTGSTFTV